MKKEKREVVTRFIIEYELYFYDEKKKKELYRYERELSYDEIEIYSLLRDDHQKRLLDESLDLNKVHEFMRKKIQEKLNSRDEIQEYIEKNFIIQYLRRRRIRKEKCTLCNEKRENFFSIEIKKKEYFVCTNCTKKYERNSTIDSIEYLIDWRAITRDIKKKIK